jgi:hypothetical protein
MRILQLSLLLAIFFVTGILFAIRDGFINLFRGRKADAGINK